MTGIRYILILWYNPVFSIILSVRSFNDTIKAMTNPFLSIVILLFTCIYIQESKAQSAEDPPKKTIKYIGQISNADHSSIETGLFENLLNMISGKKEQNLQRPFNIAMKDSNRIYIIDQGNQGLIVQTESDRQIYKSSLADREFSSPVGLCMLDEHSVLFTDSKLNMIFIQEKIDHSPRQWETDFNLVQPTGICFNLKSNHIWVVETARHCASKFDRNGKRIKQIGIRGEGEGQFNFPTFICSDDSGYVYIVDSMNFRVQIFDTAGNFVSMFGQAGDASGYFARPKGIAIDSDGYIYIDPQNRIYIADTYNNRIQIFQRYR